ncbi:hypothetical protein [Haliea sp. E17]|uniref:hypothetical protein n=1 Tax=Haliea sp. E17 TaxID=3401576 RepID=UPI003AAA9FB4
MRLFYSMAVLACLLVAGCAGAPSEQPRPAAPAERVDFSGAWEVDYSQSDSVNDAYEQLMTELRRQAQRQSQGMGQGPGTLSAGGAVYGSSAGIYALARMAEVITEPQLLEIDQGDSDISVKREGSFALECDFSAADAVRDSAFGRELCGWRDHQLLFQVELPDGLHIRHRFTLAPDGQRLQVVTQLFSRQVSQPFSVARVYNRYDPNRSGIHCRQTLSRGRVCTTEQAPQ